ncbi:unnamed protein product [Ixodes persulcatus]
MSIQVQVFWELFMVHTPKGGPLLFYPLALCRKWAPFRVNTVLDVLNSSR